MTQNHDTEMSAPLMTPDLSIIIPTCDRPGLLGRAVASALRAAPHRAEVLVIDDGTQSAAATLSQVTDPRLRILRNPDRRGEPSARNHGLRAARAPLILFLDDDDEMLPDYPARVLRTSALGQARWGGCAVRLRTPGQTDRILSKTRQSGALPATLTFRRYLIAASAGFWADKALLLAVGGFDPDQWIDCDTDLCCRLIAARHFPNYDTCPGVIVHRGWTDPGQQGQLTRTTDPNRAAACYGRTLRTSGRALAAQPGATRFLLLRYLRRAMRAGHRPDLRTLLDLLPGPVDRIIVRGYVLLGRIRKRPPYAGPAPQRPRPLRQSSKSLVSRSGS